MKTYRVCAILQTPAFCDIEADTIEEAIEMVDKIGSHNFEYQTAESVLSIFKLEGGARVYERTDSWCEWEEKVCNGEL